MVRRNLTVPLYNLEAYFAIRMRFGFIMVDITYQTDGLLVHGTLSITTLSLLFTKLSQQDQPVNMVEYFMYEDFKISRLLFWLA